MSAKTRKPQRIERFTPDRRLKELRSFVSLCFASLETGDVREISNSTGLSTSTLYRLRHQEFSLRTQFRTIQALGLAARLQLHMTRTSAHIVVLD